MENQTNQRSRDAVIVRTSLIGVGANLLLAGSKAAIGFLSNSISVVLDAVNNLSDVLSSVITIVGAKLAGRKPDKKHPLGHGRIEYISTMLVAAVVLYAGVTAMVESVKDIFDPDVPDYSPAMLVILALAVVVKIVLGTYVKRTGKRVNSGSLTASGTDALFDAILSASVLLSAVIYMFAHVNLEAYVGVLISVFILRAGVGMLLETLSEILGKRVDRNFLSELHDTICADPDVHGAYDLILHSYGPERYIGSVHVEVDDTMTADAIDLMERRIAENVYRRHGVVMTGIGIYSRNTQDDAVARIRSDVTRIVESVPGVLQMHGFYADAEKKTIQLDVILDFALEDRQKTFEEIRRQVQEAFPDFTIHMVLDIDF